MFCPHCGRALTPPPGRQVAFPMHVCGADGIVYDEKRAMWYGLPEVGTKLCCPGCGAAMDGEPKEPPVRIFVCYQCGITFDRATTSWFGLAYHAAPGP